MVYDEASDRKFVKWCVNLDAIISNIDNIIGFEEEMRPYTGPSLFINGGLSVKNEEPVYRKYFPECHIITVEGAGHYVHTDKPKVAVEAISMFLDKYDK